MKTTFTCETDYDGQPRIVTIKETNAEGLADIIAVFEEFLRGCGFYFDGHLDFTEEL